MIRRLIFIVLFWTLQSQLIFADYYEIDISNKVINFSSYCKSGKVTIFEISTAGCAPCEVLKRYLKNQHYDMEKVDIYHCLMNGSAKEMWGYCEGVTSFPVVYIYGPAKNPVKIYHAKDNDYDLNRIDNNINMLLESLTYFQVKLVDENRSQGINNSKDEMKVNDMTIEINQLKIENRKLNNEKIKLIQDWKNKFKNDSSITISDNPEEHMKIYYSDTIYLNKIADLETHLNRKIYLVGLAEFIAIIASVFIIKFKK